MPGHGREDYACLHAHDDIDFVSDAEEEDESGTDAEKEDESDECVILDCQSMPPKKLVFRRSLTPTAEDMLATLPYQGGEGPRDRSRSPPRRLGSIGSAAYEETGCAWSAAYEHWQRSAGEAPEDPDTPDSHPINLPAEPAPWGRGWAEWTPPRSFPESEFTVIRCRGDEAAMLGKGGAKGHGKERSVIPVEGLRPSRQTWTSCWTSRWTYSDLRSAAPIKYEVDLSSLNWDAKGGYVTEQWEWALDGASSGDKTEMWESSWLTKWATVANKMKHNVDLVSICWDLKTGFVTEKWEWTSVGEAAVDAEGGLQPRPGVAGSEWASVGVESESPR